MDAWKAQRAANEAAQVRMPKGNGCWAWVRKPSNGSMLARTVGRWGNCSRSARSGHRTCAQHAYLEVAAQSLSAGVDIPDTTRDTVDTVRRSAAEERS